MEDWKIPTWVHVRMIGNNPIVRFKNAYWMKDYPVYEADSEHPFIRFELTGVCELSDSLKAELKAYREVCNEEN